MYQATKETIISDVMLNAPESAPLFMEIGMHCMGCAMATGETVEQACEVHGVDADEFLAKLNAFIAKL
jgi:hybrid cluster-associated redox disulfide protein